MNSILFTLVYNNEDVQVQTSKNRYYSLMGLISDYLEITGFGLCSGMGSCGTCLVTIDGVRELACTISIDDDLANTRIVVQPVRL